MRPYLTVIIDSFHEAFASRVLYILLLVLTLVLVCLAPLSYTETRAVGFSRMSLPNIPAFLTELREQDAAEDPSPGKRLVEMADQPFQELVRGAGEGDAAEPITRISGEEVNVFVHGMNELLKKRDLYDADVWKGANLGEEAKDLLKEGPDNLPAEQLAVLNRLLLHGAFPLFLGTVPNEELYLSYAWLTTPEPLPIPKQMFPTVVKLTLSAFMNFFVGTIAIFVAILVTAPIMPRTFEPGAIDLLLSKPVSRSLLVIAKYIGGCAFIFLSVTYFIVGLWLIVGWRFDLWSQPLLLCIPVFMFQFAIYYAVSVLAGVLWRNPIVSIVVTVLFFLACFSVGTAKIALEQSAINPSRLVRLVPTDEALVGVTQMGKFVQWNAAQEEWEDVLQTPRRGGPMGIVMDSVLVGPVYHQPSQELLYLEQPSGRGRGRFGASSSEFKTAKWTGNWVPSTGPNPPTGASWILQDKDDHVLIVSSTGVYLYQPEGAAKKANILGFNIPLGGDKTFSRLGPDEGLPYTAPFAAALDRASNRLLIENQGTLYLLSPGEDGKYTIDKQAERDQDGAAVVGLSSKFAVVVDEKGHVDLRDAYSLEVKQTFRPAGNSAPNVIEVSPNGNYIAVLFHDGVLWLYDSASEQGRRIDSDASAVAFQENQILIADAKTRVRIENLGDGQTVATYSPKSDWLRFTYDWVLQPLYFLFPKPGELSNVVEYLLTDESTQSLAAGPASSGDLREVRASMDITTPLIHNAIFICVMLGITCLYVSRLDL